MKLKLKSPQISYNVGDDFNLTCEIQVANNRSFDYVWQLGKISLEKYNFKNVAKRENMLMIKNAQPELNGLWECHISNPYGHNYYEASSLYIDIIENRFEVELTSNTTNLLENDSTNLECKLYASSYENYSGNQKKVQFKWEKVDGTLPYYAINSDTAKGQSIKLYNLKETDSGIYACHVQDKNIISNKAFITLKVNTMSSKEEENDQALAAPKVKLEYYEFGKNYFKEGETAYIFCDVTGNPKPTLEWRRVDGKPLSGREKLDIREEYALLEVFELQLNDTADYECVGRNSLGVSKERLNIIVLSEGDYSKLEGTKFLSLMGYHFSKSKHCIISFLNKFKTFTHFLLIKILIIQMEHQWKLR